MKLVIIAALLTFIVVSGLTMFLTGTFRDFQALDEATELAAEEQVNGEGEAASQVETEREKLQSELADYEAQITAAAAKLADSIKKITEAEAELTAVKADIDSFNAAKEHISRTQQLAKLYASMKPDSAAEILCKLEKDLAMRIISQMDNRTSGKLMEAIVSTDPDYAAKLSILMADSKMPGNNQDSSESVSTNN